VAKASLTLLELVLSGSFRSNRHGRLLLHETLPPGPPVQVPEVLAEAAGEVWGQLVELTEAEVRDPWKFERLVRRLHAILGDEAGHEAYRRFELKWRLVFGPWELTTEEGYPAGEPLVDEDELRRAWGWAKHEPASHNYPAWDESCWAVRRFELGEEPVRAFVECRRLSRNRRAA
jgi:hypothetical protein